jgi:hypothetical protein
LLKSNRLFKEFLITDFSDMLAGTPPLPRAWRPRANQPTTPVSLAVFRMPIFENRNANGQPVDLELPINRILGRLIRRGTALAKPAAHRY